VRIRVKRIYRNQQLRMTDTVDTVETQYYSILVIINGKMDDKIQTKFMFGKKKTATHAIVQERVQARLDGSIYLCKKKHRSNTVTTSGYFTDRS
jgi:hypothetical protein